MTDYHLISSDSHVTMPDEAWPEYLDPEFRDRAPRIERTDEGDFRVFEGKRTPIMTLDNLAGKKPEQFTLNVRTLNEQRAGAWDPAERVKDMDTDGVDEKSRAISRAASRICAPKWCRWISVSVCITIARIHT